FAANAGQRALIAAQDGVGQRALRGLELENLFLDRALRDEACRDHTARLPNAMRAVDRLRFDGGVPPRIEKIHIVGGREIQSVAARLETHEKERRSVRRLKAIDACLAIARGTVEILVR